MTRTNTLLFIGLLLAIPAYMLVSAPRPVSDQTESLDGFVLVEAGSFMMGSHNGAKDETPVHKVTISRSFYMSKYEVTVGEFRRFAEDTGYRTTAEQQGWAWVYIDGEWVQASGASWRNPQFSQDDGKSMVCVSWYDAVKYCNWLSMKTGLTVVYSGSGENIHCDFGADGFRLPTEAEWEYASRGGGKSRAYNYAGTDDAKRLSKYANFADRNIDLGWSDKDQDDGYEYTSPVGVYEPNELELHDMSGNVWEWCWDWYGEYTSSPATDPRGSISGIFRVYRGGSWFEFDYSLRTTYRVNKFPSDPFNDLGFRPVRTCPNV